MRKLLGFIEFWFPTVLFFIVVFAWLSSIFLPIFSNKFDYLNDYNPIFLGYIGGCILSPLKE